MKTGAKIAIGVGVAAAVAGVVWYMRGKKNVALPNQTASSFDPTKFGYDPNLVSSLFTQLPGSPVEIYTPSYPTPIKPVYQSPVYTPAPQPVYADLPEMQSTMIKRGFVEENLAGLRGISYLLR